jgi:hypothetical protein
MVNRQRRNTVLSFLSFAFTRIYLSIVSSIGIGEVRIFFTYLIDFIAFKVVTAIIASKYMFNITVILILY